MAASMFKPPAELNITDDNVSQNFSKWKRQMEVYLTASGVNEKEKETQVAVILLFTTVNSDLGEVHLKVDKDATPKALPCQNVPLAIKDQVKQDLDSLVQRGILKEVTEPTKWVSQMAVVRKPNGKLRLCIDPQPLNQALMREHYKLPVLEDILPELHDAKMFKKK
ncbi:uncharacterized protein LOC128205917 [Mya arenaria]|uniref:uncharacterized protein LOC128205917 n=1 Tax=Mya arenaria TaxID=6604 RepID=UPI0022E34C9A|nr:uncharacterized protein LOC128205917 [Mya arenaria]